MKSSTYISEISMTHYMVVTGQCYVNLNRQLITRPTDFVCLQLPC